MVDFTRSLLGPRLGIETYLSPFSFGERAALREVTRFFGLPSFLAIPSVGRISYGSGLFAPGIWFGGLGNGWRDVYDTIAAGAVVYRIGEDWANTFYPSNPFSSFLFGGSSGENGSPYDPQYWARSLGIPPHLMYNPFEGANGAQNGTAGNSYVPGPVSMTAIPSAPAAPANPAAQAPQAPSGRGGGGRSRHRATSSDASESAISTPPAPVALTFFGETADGGHIYSSNELDFRIYEKDGKLYPVTVNPDGEIERQGDGEINGIIENNQLKPKP